MTVVNSTPGYVHDVEAAAGTNGAEATKLPTDGSEHNANGRTVESEHEEIDELWDDSDAVVRQLYQPQDIMNVTLLAAMY